jgi:hypothetical protein
MVVFTKFESMNEYGHLQLELYRKTTHFLLNVYRCDSSTVIIRKIAAGANSDRGMMVNVYIYHSKR